MGLQADLMRWDLPEGDLELHRIDDESIGIQLFNDRVFTLKREVALQIVKAISNAFPSSSPRLISTPAYTYGSVTCGSPVITSESVSG